MPEHTGAEGSGAAAPADRNSLSHPQRELLQGGGVCYFIARIFQHEFDHIRGMLFIDRVEDTHELVTEKEYLRIIR